MFKTSKMFYKMHIYIAFILIYIIKQYDTKCFKTTLISNDEIISNINDANNMLINHLNYNAKEIKLNKFKNTACFTDENTNTEIHIRYFSSIEKCEQMQTLYYIPKNPNIICKNTKKTNYGNKQFEPCKENRLETIESYFIDTIGSSKIVNKGCQNQYSSMVNGAMWWVAILKNYNHSGYKVQKCVNSYNENKIQIIVYRNKTLISDKYYILTNNIIHNEKDFDIYIEKLYNGINSNGFLTKCFMIDIDDPKKVSVIDDCNDNNSLIPGLIGEIKCPNEASAREASNKCQIARNMFYPIFDDYDLKNCKLENMNYTQIAQKNILPVFNYDTSINYTILNNINEKSYSIRHLYGEVMLNIQTNLGIVTKVDKTNCDIINDKIIKIDPTYIYQTQQVNFTINVKSNTNSTVLLQCEDPDLRILPVIHIGNTEFYETTISFLPSKSIYDTLCDIFCDDEIELRNVKFIAQFIILDNNTNNVELSNNNGIISNSDNSVSIGDVIMEYLTDAYNYLSNIFSKYSTWIITILIVCLLIGLFILIRFFSCFSCLPCCFKLCCKCNKKNNNYSNKNTELTEIIVTKNKKNNNLTSSYIKDIKNKKVNTKNIFSSNILYSYNNDTIKIFNSEYKIKPNGLFFNKKKIINSIPKIIFFNNDYEYNVVLNNIVDRNDGTEIASNCISSNVKLHKNSIIKNNILFYNLEPIAIIKKDISKEIIILDKNYKNVNNSLYRDNTLIISNFFIDFN